MGVIAFIVYAHGWEEASRSMFMNGLVLVVF
jgi:hypothetical protein